MKMLKLSIPLIFLISSNALAQSGKLLWDIPVNTKAPLYLLKIEGEAKATENLINLQTVLPTTIANMEILKDKEAAAYGDKGKNGVILITLKKDAELLTTTQLLDKYKITGKSRKLPLFADSIILLNINDALFSPSKIKRVTVETKSGTGKKYISIITDYVKFKPDPNTTYIRGNVTSAIK